MPKFYSIYDFEYQLTANRIDVPCGDCSACVVRHFSWLCGKMTCHDDDFNHVYWTLRDGTAWDVPAVFQNARTRGLDIRAICLQKIKESYSR